VERDGGRWRGYEELEGAEDLGETEGLGVARENEIYDGAALQVPLKRKS